MRSLFLIVAAALLSACAAPSAHGPTFRQAVRPLPPARAPLPTVPLAPSQPGGGTPGYSPPPVGVPVQPGAHPAPLSPSPNKRVLPPSKEAGVWAADGDPVLSGSGLLPLFGVPLQFPEGFLRADKVINTCVAGLMDAATETGHVGAIAALPLPVRKCMAARALAFCTKTVQEDFIQARMQYDVGVPGEIVTAAEQAAERARATVERDCREADLGDALWRVLTDNMRRLNDVKAEWKTTADHQSPNPFLR